MHGENKKTGTLNWGKTKRSRSASAPDPRRHEGAEPNPVTTPGTPHETKSGTEDGSQQKSGATGDITPVNRSRSNNTAEGNLAMNGSPTSPIRPRTKSLGEAPTSTGDLQKKSDVNTIEGTDNKTKTTKIVKPNVNALERTAPSEPVQPENPLKQKLAQQSEGWRLLQQSLENLQSEIEELSARNRVGNLKRKAAELREQTDYMRSLYRPESSLGTSLPHSLSVVGEVFLHDLEGQLADLQNTMDLVKSSTMPLHEVEAMLSSDLRTLESEIGDASTYLADEVAKKLREDARALRASFANLQSGHDGVTSDLVAKLQSFQVQVRKLSSQLDNAREEHEQLATEQRDTQIPWAEAWSKFRDIRVALQQMNETFGETLVRAYGSDLKNAVEAMYNVLVIADSAAKDKLFVGSCKQQVEKLYQRLEEVAGNLNEMQNSSSNQQEILLLRITPMKFLSLLDGAKTALTGFPSAESACTELRQLCQQQVGNADDALALLRASRGADSPESRTSHQALKNSKALVNKTLSKFIRTLDAVPVVILPPEKFFHIFRLLSFVLESLGMGGDEQRVKCLTNVLNHGLEDNSLTTYARYADQSLAILELAHDWLPSDSFTEVASVCTKNFGYVEPITGMTNLNFLTPIMAKLSRAPLTGTSVCNDVTKEMALVVMRNIAVDDMTNLIGSVTGLGALLGLLFTEEVAEVTLGTVIDRSTTLMPHTKVQTVNLCTQIQSFHLPRLKEAQLLESYLPQYLLKYSVVNQGMTVPGIISDLKLLGDYIPNTCPALAALDCQTYINKIPGKLAISCIEIVSLCLSLGTGADPMIDALASRHNQEKPFRPEFGDITHMVLEVSILRRLADPRSAVLTDILFSALPSIRYASGVEGGAGARVVVSHDKPSGRLLLGFDEVSPHTGTGHAKAIGAMEVAHQNAAQKNSNILVIRTMAELRTLRGLPAVKWVRLENPLLMLAAWKA